MHLNARTTEWAEGNGNDAKANRTFRNMRPMRRLCILTASSGVIALSMTGIAAADPGQGCTVGGAPPGQFISFIAQNIGHSGGFNPGNGHGPVPGTAPFVPTHENSNCNPTENPSPPNRQP